MSSEFGVPASPIGQAPGVLEQHVAVVSDEQGPGELIGLRELLRRGPTRPPPPRLRSFCEDEIQPRVDASGVTGNSTPPSKIVAARLDQMLSTPTRSGTRNCRSRPVGAVPSGPPSGRDVMLDLGPLEAVRVAGGDGAEMLHARMSPSATESIGAERIDEIDPELLVGLGPVVGQGLRVVERGGTFVEDGQVKR